MQPEKRAKNRLDYILSLANVGKNDRVLNVGVSNIPEIEIALENQVKECWTIDLDRKKLDNARKYLKKTKLIHGNIYDGSLLKKGYFDTIIILEVLEHLEDDNRAVKILKSYLKKGGTIIASVPNRHLLHLFNPVMYTQHKRHYSNLMAKQLFSRNGLHVDHLNVVECWTLLASLYYHLIMKVLFRREVSFGIFKGVADRTYGQINKSGLDIVLRARNH